MQVVRVNIYISFIGDEYFVPLTMLNSVSFSALLLILEVNILRLYLL